MKDSVTEANIEEDFGLSINFSAEYSPGDVRYYCTGILPDGSDFSVDGTDVEDGTYEEFKVDILTDLLSVVLESAGIEFTVTEDQEVYFGGAFECVDGAFENEEDLEKLFD